LKTIGVAVAASGAALILLAALLVVQAAAQPAATTARPPKSAPEFDRMFEDIKNWGKWGPEDQLGSLNWITEQKRKQAAGLVKLGRAVGLAFPLQKELALDSKSALEQTMNLSYPGAAMDTYKIYYHGTLHTHLDALCHLMHKNKGYNGFPAGEVLTYKGCTKLGVENLKNGIVTRGVIVDIPRLRNVPYLEPGAMVYAEDIEAWEKKTGVTIAAGDAVFLRTGRFARRAKLGPWDIHTQGAAGFHASVGPWFKKRGVAVLGSDAELDVLPSGIEGVVTPVHELAIAALGIIVLDNVQVEPAADLAAQVNRYEFMLSISPLVVNGGTGAPVTPLAIF
jgi:kynurenine formamidase